MDVVGYAKLMGADEVSTLARLKAHRAELSDPTTQENGGLIFKLMGGVKLVASVVNSGFVRKRKSVHSHGCGTASRFG